MTQRRGHELAQRPRAVVIGIAVLLLAISGCSAASPSPSTSGSGDLPVAVTPRFPGYLRVEVTSDGRVLVEEVEMSVVGLSTVLDGMATPPTILYHRSNPNEDPPPIFTDVLDAIASRKLPIQLVTEDFTAPNYSPPPQ